MNTFDLGRAAPAATPTGFSRGMCVGVGWLDSQRRVAEVHIDQALAAPRFTQGSVQDPSLAQGRTHMNGALSPKAPAAEAVQAPVIVALARSR